MPAIVKLANVLRETILDAAVAEAALHGIRRLSVVDVARRAGISRPTLYKHFPSKDALVAEAVRREAERLTSSVLDAAAGHDSPERALEAGILAALRLTREHPSSTASSPPSPRRWCHWCSPTAGP